MAKNIGFNIHLSINGQDVVVNCKKGVQDLGRALGTIPGAAGKAGSAIQAMGAVSSSLRGVYDGINSLKTVCSELTGAYKIQEENEIKLETVMRQRMGATDGMINSIKDLASAQQKQGVVGDEVQLAGAQQVATFLSQKESIEALLPAMNNLAVQRKGLNVTAEDMVNIGNLVGKVMQGNVGALTRVGITFTEAEKKAIKYGNEQERAAALAKVITNNVGNMNAELANTDAGKAKQMANDFGDMQERLGEVVSKYEVFFQSFSQIEMIVTGIAQLGNAVIGVTRALFSMTEASAIASLNHRIATSVVSTFTTALGIETVSITGATIAVKALTWALRALEVASVIGAIFAGASIALEALGLTADSTTESLNSNTEAMDENAAAARRMSERQTEAQDQINSAVSSLTGKYSALQEQWNALKTDAEKTAWIKKNQSAFAELGVRINNVNDAYSIFVKNAPKVIEALQAIAEAEAYKGIYQKAIQDKYQWEHRHGSRATGDYYTPVKEGQKTSSVSYEDIRAAGITWGDTSDGGPFGGVTFTAEGARKMNAYYNSKANKLRNDRQNEVNKNLADARDAYRKASRKGIDAQNELNALGGKDLPAVTSAAGGRRRTTGGGTTGGGHGSGSDRDKPKVLIQNPTKKSDYENNSEYYEQQVAKLNANNPNDIPKIKHLLEMKKLSDDVLKRYDELEDVVNEPLPDDELQTYEQLDYAVQYYSDKLKTANADDRKSIQQHIDKLQNLRKSWDDAAKGVKPEFAPESIADYEDQVQKLDATLRNVNLSEAERNRILRERKGLQAYTDAKSLSSDTSGDDASSLEAIIRGLQQRQSELQQRRTELLGSFKNQGLLQPNPTFDENGKVTDMGLNFKIDGMDELSDVARLLDEVAEMLGVVRKRKGQLDKASTKNALIDQYGGDMVQTQKNIIGLAQSFQTCGATAETVGSAIAFAGQSLQQLGGDSAAAKAGAIAAALGQLALGFAYATSDAGKKGGWATWLAFSLAGLATLLTMVNTLSGFATGGIVGGSSYSGDKIPVRVNSGEMILTARQQARLFAIANGALQPYITAPAYGQAPMGGFTVNTGTVSGGGMIGGNVNFTIKGRNLVGTIANESRHGSRIGKRTMIKI